CRVRPSRSGTRIMVRRAISVALRIDSGTSRALPVPKPTRPRPPPTITSAAKPKRRPPFTTLATRLMPTSFSIRSESSRSRSRSRPRSSLCPRAIFRPFRIPSLDSERQASLVGSVGQSLHTPVIDIAAAIEHHGRNARLQRALRDQLANSLGRVERRRGLQLVAHIRLEGRGRSQGHPLHSVDDLHASLLAGTDNRQARTPAGLLPQLRPYPQ